MASQSLQLTSANQPHSDGKVWKIDELGDLLNTLHPVAHKCIYFGIQLEIPDSKLQAIEEEHTNPFKQLREILRYRLRQAPLTLHDIVQALQSNYVQEKQLATDIESQYRNQPSVAASQQVTGTHTSTAPPPHIHHSVFQSTLQPNISIPNFQPHPPQYSTFTPPPNPPTSTPSQPQAEAAQPPSSSQPSSSQLMSVPVTSQAMPGPSPQLSQDVAAPHPLQVGEQQALQGQPPLQHIPSHQPQTVAHSHGTGSDSGPLQAKAKRKLPMIQSHGIGFTNSSSRVAQSHSTGSDIGPPQAKRGRLDSLLAQSQDTGSQPLSFPMDTSFFIPPQAAHLPLHGLESKAQYISYVKEIYRSSVVERNPNVTKWPLTPSIVFINLVCIDWKTIVTEQEADEITQCMVRDGSVDVILKKKRRIDFGDITRDLPDIALQRVILVEGAPGVGKSTFSWEFCRRWERGEIAQQYQLVLLLRLRDERVSRARSLGDLILHSSNHICLAVLQELESTLGVNTLIILEGFDELPSTCRTQSSVFLQLIHGQLLPLATVLVTSRPWATQDIHRECSHRIFQHIEILGFSGKQIEEYVTSVFTDGGKLSGDRARVNIEEVMSYIKTHPQIISCMYIPLNSAIVVSVYQESKAGRCILPRTSTELYSALIQTLLLRYLYGHPEYGQWRWKIQSLKEDLPPDVYSKLLALCELAYSGICTDQKGSVQLIFTNLPSDFETLGLMQSVPQLYVTQPQGMSHNFLHLTVQEFLAALHISNMFPEKQLEHFQRQRKKEMEPLHRSLQIEEEGRWRRVLGFLAGITKLANYSLVDTRALLLEEPNIHTNSYREDVYSVTRDMAISSESAGWMFETQRDDIVPLALQERTVEFKGQRGLTPLDYYSLGYCIGHSHCQWVLTIEDDKIGGEEVRMLVAGANTRCDTSARVVGLRGRQGDEEYGGDYCPLSISAEALHILFTGLENVIHLQELHLTLPEECSSIPWPDLSGLRVLHIGIRGERNWRLDTLLPLVPLESFSIKAANYDTIVVLEDCESIGMLLFSSNCLKYLHFDQVSIDAQGMESVNKAMSENASLPLRDLKMECYCTFSDSAANSLALLIRKSTTLHHLSIANCITDTGLATLALALYHNSTLRDLNLSNNDITDTGSAALAQALPFNSVLKKLNLSNNTIGDTGLATLAQALHHNSILDRLDLSNNNVTDAGSAALAQLATDYPHLRVSHRVFLDKEGTVEEEKQRQLLNEALEKGGYISTGLDVLLFIGAAGSGKTCYRHLCLGLPPPEVRDSTGLSEPPVRTMSHVRGAVKQIPQNEDEPNYQWTEVSDVQLKELIMEAVGKGEVENISDPTVVTVSESKVPDGSLTLDSKHNLDSNAELLSDIQREDVENNKPDGLELHVDQRTSKNKAFNPSEKPISTRDVHYKSSLYQELLDAMRKIKPTPPSQRSQVKLLDVNWVYIVDSGGQPQFREMLPILVQMATACVLTLKLNEPLGELNEVECIEEGEELCEPYLSVLTNKQIIKHCSQIVDSQTEDCALFIVGTHEDKEQECTAESRADKNRTLRKLLEPQLGNKLEKYTEEEVIYPVNSKAPEEKDEEVVQQFRNAVHAIREDSSKEKVKIPLHWFLLELLLRQIATKNARNHSKSDAENDTKVDIKGEILSFEGCKQAAMDQLKMSEETFLAAVKFLAERLGTILYFPDIKELKHIIFLPQALMSILSEIVKIRHHLNKDRWSACYQRHQNKWSQFRNFGMIDKTLLQTAPLKNLFPAPEHFTPEHFFILMEKLLIAANITDTHYFFPSVLEELPPRKVQEKTLKSCMCLAPLVLHFSNTDDVDWTTKENWLPVGSFTSLVVQLLNVKRWKPYRVQQKPICLYRNCIQLTRPNEPGIVTLVNQFSHVEVYLQEKPEIIKDMSKAIGSTIHHELKTVCEHLNYSKKEIQKAFLCPCEDGSHIATLHQLKSGQLRWMCTKYSTSVELTDKQWPWLHEDQEKVTDNDLPYLENILEGIAHKSGAFGRQLGVKPHEIAAIENQYSDPKDQLYRIIYCRLKQLPILTWSDVIQALQSNSVKENVLAKEISQSKHPN